MQGFFFAFQKINNNKIALMMKAVRNYVYGPAQDVLKIENVPIPTPTKDQVLVKIKAAGVNSADWRLIMAQPFLVRTALGMTAPSKPGNGTDIAGVIEQIPDSACAEASEWSVGDAVVCQVEMRGGAYAEYAVVPTKNLVPKPACLSFEEAAALPLAGTTVLQGLRDHGKVKAGQKVLITGASGGCGSLAVAIAKAMGCHVTAVASGKKLDVPQFMGADVLVDYEKDDWWSSGEQYDCVLDCAGQKSAGSVKGALAPDGHFVVVGFSSISLLFGTALFWLPGFAMFSKKSVHIFDAHDSVDDVRLLTDMAKDGKLRPFLDPTPFSLDETADAIDHVYTRKVKGKVVIVP